MLRFTSLLLGGQQGGRMLRLTRARGRERERKSSISPSCCKMVIDVSAYRIFTSGFASWRGSCKSYAKVPSIDTWTCALLRESAIVLDAILDCSSE